MWHAKPGLHSQRSSGTCCKAGAEHACLAAAEIVVVAVEVCWGWIALPHQRGACPPAQYLARSSSITVSHASELLPESGGLAAHCAHAVNHGALTGLMGRLDKEAF